MFPEIFLYKMLILWYDDAASSFFSIFSVFIAFDRPDFLRNLFLGSFSILRQYFCGHLSLGIPGPPHPVPSSCPVQSFWNRHLFRLWVIIITISLPGCNAAQMCDLMNRHVLSHRHPHGCCCSGCWRHRSPCWPPWSKPFHQPRLPPWFFPPLPRALP